MGRVSPSLAGFLQYAFEYDLTISELITLECHFTQTEPLSNSFIEASILASLIHAFLTYITKLTSLSLRKITALMSIFLMTAFWTLTNLTCVWYMIPTCIVSLDADFFMGIREHY